MTRYTALFAALALLCTTAISSLHANASSPVPPPLATARATTVAIMTPLPLSPDARISTPVQSRACRSCRNYCYNEYRRYCGYSDSCRSSFTVCMRDCWEQICR